MAFSVAGLGVNRAVMKGVLAAHGRRRNVVVDGVAENVIVSVARGDVLGCLADHHRQLGLRMHSSIVRLALDGPPWPTSELRA